MKKLSVAAVAIAALLMLSACRFDIDDLPFAKDILDIFYPNRDTDAGDDPVIILPSDDITVVVPDVPPVVPDVPPDTPPDDSEIEVASSYEIRAERDKVRDEDAASPSEMR